MALHESGEMYLETILILSQRNGYVRSVDVAEYMDFSKPSVSRAVGILVAEGYLEVGRDGGLLLTDSGRKIAETIYERHEVLSNLLIKLGVSEENAVADACRIEHDISVETFDAIKRAAAKLVSEEAPA